MRLGSVVFKKGEVMSKNVHVRHYTRRSPEGFGDLVRHAPKTPGEKPKEPWELTKELVERETKAAGGDSIAGFLRANRIAEERGLSEVARALEQMEDDDRSEPSASFIYSEDDDPEFPEYKTIGSYHDDTDGEFKVSWHRTDAWRGYNEVEASDKNQWTKVHEDNILAMSEDAEKLKRFDDIVLGAMKKAGIKYVRATSTSSNLFSSGYDLFVEADQAERAESLINMLGPIFRDPRQYYATALTGKDPRELTEGDIAFVNIASVMLSKEPKENKKEMLREALMRSGFDPDLVDKLGEI